MNWIADHSEALLAGGFLGLGTESWISLLAGYLLGFTTNLFVARMSRFADLRDEALRVLEEINVVRIDSPPGRDPLRPEIPTPADLVWYRPSDNAEELVVLGRVSSPLKRIGHKRAAHLVDSIYSDLLSLAPPDPPPTRAELDEKISRWKERLRGMKPNYLVIFSPWPKL